MKICIFSDVHWSKNTSIVCSRGKKYSTRLELLIKSMNWVNELAVKEGCESMICLGDMFDKSQVTADEITPLKEIKWNKLKTYYLVGNHESNVASLEFSTVDLFRNKRVEIVSKIKLLQLEDCQILFLPYITEDNRLPLYDYMKDLELLNKKLVICSHNELKGINYGAYESKVGFDLDDITGNCNLYLNGHLHNGEWITNKILNVGSLSAHNFTNDSYRYRYGAWILDTKDLSMTFYENPYSLNFYKVVIEDEKDLSKLVDLKPNAVVSVKCKENLTDKVRKYLSVNNVIASKLSFTYSNTVTNETTLKDIEVSDHLVKFRDFILSRDDIDNIDIFKEELVEVCK